MRLNTEESRTSAAAAEQPAPRPAAIRIAEFLLVAACTLAFGFTGLGIVHSLLEKNAAGQRDFVEYWAGGQLLAQHRDPYDPSLLLPIERSVGLPANSSVMVIPNPPIVLPFIAPLGHLRPLPAELLWCAMLLIALGVSISAIRRLHGRPRSLLDMLAYFFAPALSCLLGGQMSMLILLGLALFLYWNRARPMLAGCALCLCALKPHLLLPFEVVLIFWIIRERRYRIAAGAMAAVGIAIAVALALDPNAFAQYSRMMAAARVDKVVIPCLSNAFRRALAPRAMWLQYLPAALGCVWAVDYYRRNRTAWDWMEHGSLLALISFAVAPYSWFTDQVLLIPAVLHGLYTTRSRTAIAALALASVAVQLAMFAGGTRLLHSPWLLLTPPVWLAWYLFAIKFRPNPRGRAAGSVTAVTLAASRNG